MSSVTFVRFWIAIASSFRALTNTGFPFLKLAILTKSDFFFQPSKDNIFFSSTTQLCIDSKHTRIAYIGGQAYPYAFVSQLQHPKLTKCHKLGKLLIA